MLKKLVLVLFVANTLPTLHAMQVSKFVNMESLIQESYDQSIEAISQFPDTVKFLPKKPITHELTQARFVNLLGALLGRSMLGITAIVFYNSNQQNEIQQLKNLFEQNKNVYLIVADIDKTEQEIKDIFNVTSPIIIYYHHGKEIARSNNFGTQDVARYIKGK